MKLPKQVLVSGVPWSVETIESEEGLCVRSPTMFVRTRKRPELEVVDTFLHELLHAALPAASERDVSATATAIAPAVLALLRANR